MRLLLMPFVLTGLLAICALSSAAQSKASTDLDPTKCWTYPIGDSTTGGLFRDGSRLFLTLSSGKIEALSYDGKKAWASEFGGSVTSNVTTSDGSVFLVTATSSPDPGKAPENVLRALSKETGITAWTAKLDASAPYYLALHGDSIVIVSKNGTLRSLNAKDGSVKWRRELAEGFAAEPSFGAGDVALSTTADQLFILSLSNGEIESMRKTAFRVTSVGQTSEQDLIVGDERGNITFFEKGSDRPYWKFKSGGEISQVDEASGGIIAVSHDNFVYFLSKNRGSVIWKKRMPGRLSGAAELAGKYVVITGLEEHDAIVLDETSGRTVARIPLGDNEQAAAIATSEHSIYLLTHTGAYSFSIAGCGQK